VTDPYRLVWPLIRRIDAERAHGWTLRALASGLPSRLFAAAPDDPILSVEAFGLRFPNPVGLAAGFDKNAAAPDALLSLGFGFVEIGSVTPRPQAGNPRPRLFRLEEDGAVINRMGFNNEGHDAVARRLAARHAPRGIVGVNLGANKDSADRVADYVRGLERLGPLGQFVVVNVSSPNTPGLRALQGRAELDGLLGRLDAANATLGARRPLLLKIAPDLVDEDLADIAAVAAARRLDGLIVSNTTITRPDSLRSHWRTEAGGLSGAPLMQLSTRVLRDLRRHLGDGIVLVGVGGIASGEDAYAKILAGASLVELYSALVYRGPALVGQIKRDLARRLRADGFASVAAAVGAGN